MIRPFHLRDLPLIYRLSEQGVSLHTEFALTHHPRLLRKALVSLIGVGRYPTYVWKDAEGGTTGFVQLHLEDSSHAHIVHAALSHDGAAETDESAPERVWLPLLEQLTAEIGRCGLHSLVAEVPEESPELLLLRQAGFAIYTRQDVWVLDEWTPAHSDGYPLAPNRVLVQRQSTDDWDIQLLYVNTVPRLVQLVEPSPPEEGVSLVLREGDELAAFVHLDEGPAGTWLQFFIHPQAETRAEALVAAAMSQYPPAPRQPIYCCVRRYQSWLQHELQALGFRRWGGQAVMVKHTVQRVRSAMPDLATLMEKQAVPGSTPVIQRVEGQDLNRQHRRPLNGTRHSPGML